MPVVRPLGVLLTSEGCLPAFDFGFGSASAIGIGIGIGNGIGIGIGSICPKTLDCSLVHSLQHTLLL